MVMPDQAAFQREPSPDLPDDEAPDHGPEEQPPDRPFEQEPPVREPNPDRNAPVKDPPRPGR